MAHPTIADCRERLTLMLDEHDYPEATAAIHNAISQLAELEAKLRVIDARHGVCPDCGQTFTVHNDDGSCVEDL